MPSKNHNDSLNKLKISFKADIDFAQGKITYEEFVRQHKHGYKEKWIEMPYVSLDFLLVQSFLKKLKVVDRLRAVKDIFGYSFKEIQLMGEFGGSVHNFFKNPTLGEGHELTETLARIAITLDIPIQYASSKDPFMNDMDKYEFLDYVMLDKKIELEDFKNNIIRPAHRVIRGYRLRNSSRDLISIFKSRENYINVRVDLRKTFYSIEFYPTTLQFIDYESINMLEEVLKLNVHFIVLSTALLRDTRKIILIGSYILKQDRDAKEFKDELIKNYQGILLYPSKKEISQFGDLS
ncbi:MAG: hypothetical protein ACQEV7_11350 [Bacillota bacterium]